MKLLEQANPLPHACSEVLNGIRPKMAYIPRQHAVYAAQPCTGIGPHPPSRPASVLQTCNSSFEGSLEQLSCVRNFATYRWHELGVCHMRAQVIETAHDLGLPTTSTIMFGHVDGPLNWARHLAAVRSLQVSAHWGAHDAKL